MSDRATYNSLLVAKLEATIGTDSTPVPATDAIQLLDWFDPSGDATIQKQRDKAIVGNSFQGLPPLKPTGYVGTWSSLFYARGPRNGLLISSSNLPDLDPYYISSGLSSTIVTTGGSESVTYKPASTSLKSITEKFYTDGKMRALFGARTDLQFSLEAGGPLEVTAARTGLYQGDSDVALPAGAVFGTTDPAIADSSISFTIDSYSAGVFRKFTWGTGNKIESGRGSLNATTGGIAPPSLRDRMLPFTCAFEEDLVATKDAEGWRKSNTPIAISFTLGTVQYNKHLFTAPLAKVEKVQVSNDNGTQVITVSGHLWDSVPANNDAFSLKVF